MEESDEGLSILFKLFTEGSYQLVLEKIFSFFDGPDLVALQMASSKLQSFIQDNFWENEHNSLILKNHWDIWFPKRTRLELNTVITCLVQNNLEIFCGLKSGKILVYNQNLWQTSSLGRSPTWFIITVPIFFSRIEKHKKEIVAMATVDDLLVSISKDADLITWSMKNKVEILYNIYII